ncbi:ribose-5-phosphate isomerase isoform X2 [Folsomia candida]|nr:ribose-5-phosphate isomerase isoform X2 [Folsomia candida]
MSELDKSVLDAAKKLAAYQAVDDHIEDGMVIGIGSGSTVVYAVERIAERTLSESMKLTCIPTSLQAKDLIIKHKLPLSDLDVNYHIDVTIDGCDECDSNLNLIKGGGGCLLQEKIVAAASKKLIIVADYTKDSTFLGENWQKGIPLEISQIGWKVVLEKLNRVSKPEGGHSILRQAVKKMGPIVTDNSNFLIDFQVGNIFKDKKSPREIETWLKTIPGILETGLFVDMANQAYFGQPDGTVRKTEEIDRK